MCLIIASPTGERIPDDILEDANRSNSHGAGVAWFEEEKIHFRKGLDLKQVKDVLDTLVKNNPHVVHFRIATHGGIRPELTHPFTIDDEASIALSGVADSVLFHNGTFGDWKEYMLQACAATGKKVPPPPMSDTRAIAFMCGVYGKHFLSILDGASRYLVFDAKVEPAKRMHVWGDWHDSGNFKFSNRGTCAFQSNYGSSSRGGGRESTNFRQAAAPQNDAATDAGTSGTPSTSSVTGPTTGTVPSTASTEVSAATKPRRRGGYTPKVSHNVWRSFSDEGLFVAGSNETTEEQLPGISAK